MDNSDDRWKKLEEIVRRVVREELAARKKRTSKLSVGFENGKWAGITKELMEAWSISYPAVDIQAELNLAAAHILSNPKKAPVSDYARFLNSWLKRTQTTLSIRSIPMRNEPPPRKVCSYCERSATSAPNRTPACDEHFRAAMDHEPILKRA